MDHPYDLGSEVKEKVAIIPLGFGSESVNGPDIDRTGYNSAVLHVSTGAATGSPSAQTCDVKIQEKEEGGSYTDVSGAAITQITADNGDEELNIDLSGLKKYVRAVATTVLTGGSSPKWPVAATLTIGGSDYQPV